MKDIKHIDGGICAPLGFKVAATHCGIRKEKLDLALIVADDVCSCAGVYTKNIVQAAPIKVTKKHLANNQARAIIVNSGNANACTKNGINVANDICSSVAEKINCAKEDIIIASTGVIGVELDAKKIFTKEQELVSNLSADNYIDAAKAIMTTDTYEKYDAIAFDVDGTEVKIGCISKGSGMIHPNMGTMLCFLTTDINICDKLLQEALIEATNDSYNMISVDGDTSTNDMMVIMSSSLANNKIIDNKDDRYFSFLDKLKYFCIEQAKKIAADGEGASKLVTCKVNNAVDEEIAKKVAKAVITSPLVKTAMFGNDANWGRILCAIGYSDNKGINIDNIDIALKSKNGNIDVCQQSFGLNFNEEQALQILKSDEVIIDINLHNGTASATAWGCDLSYDYVKINAEYRS